MKLKIGVAACFFLAATLHAQVIVATQVGLEAYYPLITAVYAKLGLKPTFRVYPSQRGLEQVNLGICDAEIGRASFGIQNFPNLILTHESLKEVRSVAWKKKNSSIVVNKTIDLKNYKIGYIRGEVSIEKLLKTIGARAFDITSLVQLVKMLDASRVQIVIVPNVIDTSELEKMAKPIRLDLPVEEAYHVFNRKHADWVVPWDNALRKMKETGEYQRLLKAIGG